MYSDVMAKKKTDTKSKTTKTTKASKVTTKTAVKAVKTVKPVQAATITSPSTQKQKLRMWNIWLAVVCAIQAVVVVLIGSNASLPITTQYLAVDPLATEAAGSQALAVATRHLFDVHISWLVAAFLVLAALMYAAQATFCRMRYERQIDRGINTTRWAGFGLAGAGVMVTVGALSGVAELGTLFMMAVSVVLAGALMACVERLLERDGGKESLLTHVVCGSSVASLLAPVVLLASIVLGATLYAGEVSGALYGVYGTMALALVAVVGAAHLGMLKKGRWADSLKTEKLFMLLGLAIVSLLAWQIFVGFLY